MAEAELLALKKVLDGPDAPEALTAALAKLEAVPVTVALIEATQIGVSVGKLRRHANAGIAESSKRLVNAWRGLLKPAAGASTPSPAPSPAPVRDSGSLKRSSSEANEDAESKKAKAEAKSEAKKTKSSSDLKAEDGGDGKRPKSEDSGELKKSKGDEGTKKSPAAKPSPAPAASKESDEETRAKCRGMLEEAMSTPPLPSAEGAKPLKEVAAAIEDALFAAYDGLSKEYRSRFRTLFQNLKNVRNTELRLQLHYGELPFDKLVRMTSDELAPRELQEEKARIAKWQREAITRGVDKGTATDLYRCGKCQQRKCTYFEMQTRSADEPMTCFITCLNCGNRWKM